MTPISAPAMASSVGARCPAKRAAPMAFIMEQAGGMATDGNEDILSLKVNSVNQRSPIYIGSRTEVTMAREFLSQ